MLVKLYCGLPEGFNETWAVSDTAAMMKELGIEGGLIQPSWGVWEGTLERCLVVEVNNGGAIPMERFQSLASKMAYFFSQVVVCMVVSEVKESSGWSATGRYEPPKESVGESLPPAKYHGDPIAAEFARLESLGLP